jgi:FkbM family methyltransferase
MQIFKKITKKIIKTVSRMFLKEKLRLGTDTYTRRLLIPNLLSRKLKYEEFLDDIYRAVLKKKEGAVIDVGVNAGQTLFKLLSIDKNRQYFGFEPQSLPASCVESFLIENKITNYCILPIALSDQNGSIPMYIRGSGIYSMASTVSSVVEDFRPKNFYNYAKYIYAARGDEIIDNLGITSISLVKIDVEGAELEVLRGLKTTIEKYRPFILFEVLHHYLVVTKEELDEKTIDFRELRIQELEQIIRSNRYHVYQINGSKEIIKIKKIKPEIVNDLESTEFIAVPVENESDFCRFLETGRRITKG